MYLLKLLNTWQILKVHRNLPPGYIPLSATPVLAFEKKKLDIHSLDNENVFAAAANQDSE